MSRSEKHKVCIGTISNAHGIRGDLKIRLYLTNPHDITSYSPLFLGDGSEFPLKKVLTFLSSGVIVSTKTLKDRDEALKMRGEKLYVDRAQLPDLDDNSYYHTDLIGLSVQNERGQEVGLVKYVHDYGAGPVLEIVDPATQESALVPFQDEAVPVVQLGSHLVVKDQYLTDLYQE